MTYEPWQPGMRATALRMRSISPTWESWTPVWTTTTGANLPSFGNATVDARYAISARTCFLRLFIGFGSTTDFGGGTTSDNWTFSLPASAVSVISIIGFAELAFSSGRRASARTFLADTESLALIVSSGAADGTAHANTGVVNALTPWTWDDPHAIRLNATYEIP